MTGAIARLTGLGILDDAAFAAQWVESRDRARPRGERALQAELRQKGIDSDTIARTLEGRRGTETAPDEAGAASPDETAARRLLTRHAAELGRVTDPRARRQRAYALLARKGFGPDVAGELAREFTAHRGADSDDEPDAPDG